MKQSRVTPQMIYCVKKDNIYPQDIQLTKTMWATFGTVGLTIRRVYPCKMVEKHLNGWAGMTVDEINEKLDAQPWVRADD